MEQKISFRNSEGLQLAGVLHVPAYEKETGIIICHGFTGSKDKNFDKLILLAPAIKLIERISAKKDFEELDKKRVHRVH